MRLNNYITELAMAKGTKIEFVEKVSGYAAREKWRITLEDGQKFNLNVFDRTSDLTAGRFWQEFGIKFDPPEDKKNNEPFDLGKEPEWWEIDFTDEEGESTTTPKKKGTGIQLFAAIIHWFKGWIKKVNPEGILIVSTLYDDSKLRLYKKFAKQIQKAGYTQLKQSETIAFYLVRNDFNPWNAK